MGSNPRRTRLKALQERPNDKSGRGRGPWKLRRLPGHTPRPGLPKLSARGGVAGRLAEALSAAFGKKEVFIDVGSIQPGEDFKDVIVTALRRRDALLALFYPKWTEWVDSKGKRRLDDPSDAVVLEIGTALEEKGAGDSSFA